MQDEDVNNCAVFIHESENTDGVWSCDLNFSFDRGGLLKVASSHVPCKSDYNYIGNDARKRCYNRKWYTSYLLIAIAMTLGVLEGHSLNLSLLYYIYAPVDNKFSAGRTAYKDGVVTY